jgi:L-cysteine/cystine lyase
MRAGYDTRVPFDLEAIRAELPLLGSQAYLNTGGTGPLPLRVARAIQSATEAQLGMARMGPEGVELTERTLEALRAATGGVVAADAADMAITANTTTGLDIVVWGIDWQPGDHIITTELEHPGLSVPIAVAARRHGLLVTRLGRSEAELELETAVRRYATPRTRLVALSHVAWSSGALLDVAGAARSAHAVGALVAIDGAQSVGAIPVDAPALGVDAYAFPAQKWLLGPEGLGALWISSEARKRVDLTFCAYEAGTEHQLDGSLQVYPEARRYEISTPPLLLCHGWLAGLQWLAEVGWDEIHTRTRHNQQAAWDALSAVDGLELITPAGPQAGLVVFGTRGHTPEVAFRQMLAHGVCVRWLVSPPALRASMAFFASECDIELLLGGVHGLRS